MNIVNKILISVLVVLSIAAGASSSLAKGWRLSSTSTSTDGALIDYNEKIHLFFLREKEKLAHDVYLTLGIMYPNLTVFRKTNDAEQRHMTVVKAMIEMYGYEDPNTSDNIGGFTGEDYGWYFTEKFRLLVERAFISELEALYVGAYIEELDFMDINRCPKVIVEESNGINDITECAKIYTDNSDITSLYDALLYGSDNHLKNYVKNIEKHIGEGNYLAQVLTQKEVNKILDR